MHCNTARNTYTRKTNCIESIRPINNKHEVHMYQYP